MRSYAWVVALAGCGRLAFDPSDGDGGNSGDVSLSYDRDEILAVVGQSTVDLQAHTTGSGLAFSVTPSLPAGLALAADGDLAGVPTAEVDRVAYTITASNARGTASFTLTITSAVGYLVSVTADFNDDDGGVDSTCFASAAGGCTLRAAVQTALSRGPQVVVIPAGDYPLTASLPTFGGDITIVGASAQATVVHPATVHPSYNAAILQAGGRLALRDLTMRDFGPVNGGAIYSVDGELDVDRCTFENNQGLTRAGVVFAGGSSQVTLRRSTFTDNQALSSGSFGGVLHAQDSATIVIDQITANGNVGEWGSFSHLSAGSTMTITNSTLYDNVSTTAGTMATPGGTYTLINVTMVHNRNVNPGPDSAGVFLYSLPCHYTIANSLIAFNTDVNNVEHDFNRYDLGATITSNGGNIIGDDGSNCGSFFTSPGDRLMTNPGLAAAPAMNGGPTATYDLLAASPAVDTANGALCPAVDQRGFPRSPQTCDVGALERQ